MAFKVEIIACSDLQKMLDIHGKKIIHIVHAPIQCAMGILTDKMILVIKE